MMGGWRWQSLDSLTDDDKRGITSLVREEKGLATEIATILAVRTQTVAGRNLHVIFSDPEGNLHAVVVYTNLQQVKSLTSFQTVIAK
jgi:hypothetical protein